MSGASPPEAPLSLFCDQVRFDAFLVGASVSTKLR